MVDLVRIGIVGAGGFTRRRLLPGLLALPGVELAAVANRTLVSAERVAQEFQIAKAFADWRDVVTSSDVDAVVIATEPYFHHEAVLAALDAGKPVLCQTRMATSVEQARQMLATAEARDVRGMLVPSGSYLRGRRYVQHLLQTGYVGQVRQVFTYYQVENYADAGAPLHRRQDHRAFGAINPLHLGIDWDVLRPWFGDPERVLAWSKAFTPQRVDASGETIAVEMPDAITVIAEMPSGAVVTCVQSGVAHFGDERIEIYGDQGTLVYSRGAGLRGGRVGDEAPAELAIPDDFVDEWRAEEEFIALVRGEINEPPGGIAFHDGVKNVEFLEAAHRSVVAGLWVGLPLA